MSVGGHTYSVSTAHENDSVFRTALPNAYKRVAFGVLAVSLTTALLAPKTISLSMLAVLFGLPLTAYLMFRIIDGDAEPLLLLWIAIFPLGYYFLSFPRDQATITFDRVIIALLAVGSALCPRNLRVTIPDDLRRCVWAWFLFLAVCLLSLVGARLALSPLRLWFDSFVLPAVLGWYVIACFPVKRYLRFIHFLVCTISIYSAGIGIAEIFLGEDLLKLPGAGTYFAGFREISILRVNGPFQSNNSFGLIGLLSFCLLAFMWQAIGKNLPRWQKALHGLGLAAALLQAMMPMFRSIFLTIAVFLVLDLFRARRWRAKALRLAVLAALASGLFLLMSSVPDLFEERVSDPGNIYARMAQQIQNVAVFRAHPVMGVGLGNFNEEVTHKPTLAGSYQSEAALDYPHSNLGAVLGETGLVGGLPYVLSQFLLLHAFWKFRNSGSQIGKEAWWAFLSIFLSYWISGLTLTSGYYSDLNLWFTFAFAIIYKFAISHHNQIGEASAQ